MSKSKYSKSDLREIQHLKELERRRVDANEQKQLQGIIDGYHKSGHGRLLDRRQFLERGVFTSIAAITSGGLFSTLAAEKAFAQACATDGPGPSLVTNMPMVL